MEISIAQMDVNSLGLTGLSVADYSRAGDAITRVDKAIDKVSDIRSGIGASMNRLEHTIANLDNTAENLQAAESRIRDLDIASAMVEYARIQILLQVGQAVLSQANQAPDMVLQLLQ